MVEAEFPAQLGTSPDATYDSSTLLSPLKDFNPYQTCIQKHLKQ